MTRKLSDVYEYILGKFKKSESPIVKVDEPVTEAQTIETPLSRAQVMTEILETVKAIEPNHKRRRRPKQPYNERTHFKRDEL